MKYFKHDSDAAMDAKHRRLRLRYGMEGYGVYWYVLELIARNVDAHNLTFELEHDAELISVDTGIHRERVEEMMRYMVELNLFQSYDGVIRCLRMASRCDEYTQKLLSKACGREVVPTKSGECPDSDGTKSELREEKRTEEKRGKRFIPPTPDEVSEYAQSIGHVLDGDRFCDFYTSKGWMVGKTTMKDWQATVRNWIREEAKKSASTAGREVWT